MLSPLSLEYLPGWTTLTPNVFSKDELNLTSIAFVSTLLLVKLTFAINSFKDEKKVFAMICFDYVYNMGVVQVYTPSQRLYYIIIWFGLSTHLVVFFHHLFFGK